MGGSGIWNECLITKRERVVGGAGAIIHIYDVTRTFPRKDTFMSGTQTRLLRIPFAVSGKGAHKNYPYPISIVNRCRNNGVKKCL